MVQQQDQSDPLGLGSKPACSRIVAARVLADMSRTEAATALDISASYYANFEDGQRECIGYVDAFAEAFRQPRSFFFRPEVDITTAPQLRYRRLRSMPISAQRRVDAAAGTIDDLIAGMDAFVPRQSVRLPHLSSLKDPSSAAEALRGVASMTTAPVRHMIDLAEWLGIFVVWYDGDDDFDGVSFWNGDRPVIIINSARNEGRRMRFTVAHEIGHLCIHKSVKGKEDEQKLDEEADAFASALLMPAGLFARRMPRHFIASHFLEEREYWGVSCWALVRRCADLNLFNDHQYKKACIEMSTAGWRKSEPGRMVPEQSTMHRMLFEEAGDSGLSSGDLALRCDRGWESFLAAFPTAGEYRIPSSFNLEGFE